MAELGRGIFRVAAAAGLCVALIGFLAPRAASGAAGGVPSIPYTVTGDLPHDSQAFTQGLVFSGGVFYESTGLNGRSSLRKVDPHSGRVLARLDLEPQYFGEGLALVQERLIQLTWQSGKAFVYDPATLRRVQELPYPAEGWGLADTPGGLVSSDGSATLTWRDPVTMNPVTTRVVTDGGRHVSHLNELEWMEGRLLANIWHEDRIAVIVPATGLVEGWIDCAALRIRMGRLSGEAVLNGIAYDPEAKILYVTGKLWPKIFQLRLEGFPKP